LVSETSVAMPAEGVRRTEKPRVVKGGICFGGPKGERGDGWRGFPTRRVRVKVKKLESRVGDYGASSDARAWASRMRDEGFSERFNPSPRDRAGTRYWR
jgi:hypothetical protein